MIEEHEFVYPSGQFFEAIERRGMSLPIVRTELAAQYFENTGSKWSKQSFSEIITRLKIEVARDFSKHEGEAEDVPYSTSYLVVVEEDDEITRLEVLTALQSKYNEPGRILYGTRIFRIGDNSFISETSYGE